MPDCLIESLHAGMNLRDGPAGMKPGETGVSVGCDFSKLGQVTPMQEGLLTWTLNATVVDAKIAYIGQTQYLFTTHSDGLRVTYADASAYFESYVLDADFTGSFCVLPVNDEYFVLSNRTISRKWKPGWNSAYQWGLNTPSTPTAAGGASSTKVISDFESLGSWVQAGGGAAGALAADLTVYTEGTQSMKLTCSANTVCTGTLASAMDLSTISADEGIGANALIGIDYYAYDLRYVRRITFKLSCAADAGFDKDYFVYTVDLPELQHTATIQNQYATAIDNAVLPVTAGSPYQNTEFTSGGMPAPAYVKTISPDGREMVYLKIPRDRMPGSGETYEITYDYVPINVPEQVTNVKSESTSWTQLKVPANLWQRVGNTSGRGWSTITALKIEIEAQTDTANVSFDNWRIIRGQAVGTYYFAVAYENEFGNYGPYSDFSTAIETTGDSIVLSGLTPDSDPQTTKRRVVVIGGSLTDFMVFNIDDNTSLTYTYDLDDSELVEVETRFYNRPPPACTDMIESHGRIFLVGVKDYANRMCYCEELNFEAFPYANYHSVDEGEELVQIAKMGDYLTVRGKNREYYYLLTASDPASWSRRPGSRHGAVTQKLLLELSGSRHVYSSGGGLYLSSLGGEDGFFLEKINPIIASFTAVKGAMAGNKAYLTFTDSDGVSRVLRIDFTHGYPLAHYVENSAPAAIFADQVLKKVYYTSGASVYEFDAGASPLATQINFYVHCNSRKLKDFSLLYYELASGPLTLTLEADRTAVSGSISLATAEGDSYPQSMPEGLQARYLKMTLVGTTQDFTIYLPWQMEVADIAA